MFLRPLWHTAGVAALPGAAAPAHAEVVEILAFDAAWEFLMILAPETFIQMDPASLDGNFLSTWTTAAYHGPPFQPGIAPFHYGLLDFLNANSFPSTLLDLPAIGSRFTVYFRTTFELEGEFTDLQFELLADDGCILYVDGEPWLSKNMRPGATSAFSELAAATGDEMALTTITTGADGVTPLPSLSPGRHTIHLSVHNSATSSSDLGFVLRLTGNLQIPAIPTLTAELSAPSTNGTPRVLLRANNPDPAATLIIQQSSDLSHWFPLSTLPPAPGGSELSLDLPATAGRNYFRLAK